MVSQNTLCTREGNRVFFQINFVFVIAVDLYKIFTHLGPRDSAFEMVNFVYVASFCTLWNLKLILIRPRWFSEAHISVLPSNNNTMYTDR